MQQHLMQMQQQQQPMMAGYNPSNVTTDHIQQYLDENKSLILKILENQNSGKLSECAENQARLQRNLMYLAAIADSQPQQPAMHAQFPNAVVQPGAHYMQHQQAQSMMPQSMMNTRSPMLYSQQQLSSIQQQQQQQQAMHNQLGMTSGGNNNGLHMMHNESGMGGGNGPMGGSGFPDFGRTNANEGLQGSSRGVTIASKHESGSAGSGDHGRGGNSGGQGGESGEQMYLKSGEEGN